MWKSKRFGKSLETFGSRIFFLSFLKSIAWYGFCYYGFLVVLNLFRNVLFKVITKFYKHCCIKEAVYYKLVSCGPKKSIG